MSKSKLLAVCLVVGTAFSCSSDSDKSNDSSSTDDKGDDADDSENDADESAEDDEADANDADGGASLSGVSTFQDVASVAKMIYNAVEANEDVAPHIKAVLEAFGVPVLQADDEDGALARIDEGLPFVTTRVVEEMAAAYAQGRLVDAEGFAEGLAEQGVELPFPYNLDESATLDQAFLGGMIYSFAILGESQPDVPLETGYVLPTLVHSWAKSAAAASTQKHWIPLGGTVGSIRCSSRCCRSRFSPSPRAQTSIRSRASGPRRASWATPSRTPSKTPSKTRSKTSSRARCRASSKCRSTRKTRQR
jgi:hypothetical protein